MKTSGPPILETRGIEARRGSNCVLRVGPWTLHAGETVGLIGPNGAGKSTFLLCLAGLLEPNQGCLIFEGRPLGGSKALSSYRKRVTLVFQEPLLLNSTVENNIGLGLRLRRMEKTERHRRVLLNAERFGITPLLKRNAGELSGGEAQRTALARAFALEPQILLLDEPFSSLDPPTRNALLKDLSVALKEAGCTMIFATHDLTEALHLSDTLAVMKEGRLLQNGPVREVVNHPADEFVAAFVGMETLLTGTVKAFLDGIYTLQVGERKIEGAGEAYPGQELTIGIRPENVTLSLHREPGSSARNSFSAQVKRITSHGPFLKVELDCGFFLSAYITARSREDLQLHEGQTVIASFKATAVHMIKGI